MSVQPYEKVLWKAGREEAVQPYKLCPCNMDLSHGEMDGLAIQPYTLATKELTRYSLKEHPR